MADNTIALQARAPNIDFGGAMQNYSNTLGQLRQMKQQDAVIQRNAMLQQKADTAEANMLAAMKMARGGDMAGAEQQYGVDPAIHKALAGLTDEKRQQVRAMYGAAASVTIQALGEPDLAKRSALIQAAAPGLAEYGWKPEQIDQIAQDPSDAALNGVLGNARTADESIKLYDESLKPYNLGQGEERRIGSNVIATGQPKPPPQGQVTSYIGADGKPQIFNVVNGVAYPVNMGGVRPGAGGDVRPGAGGGSVTGGAGKAWSPLSDNNPLSVQNKIGLIARKAGVGPDTPLSLEQFLSLDMTQLEGGAMGKNNPGNMKNVDGSWKQLNSPAEYQASQRAWLQRRWNEGYRTTSEAVAGKGANMGGGGQTPAGEPLRPVPTATEQRLQAKERETRKLSGAIGSKIDSQVRNIDLLLADKGLDEITGNWRGSVPGGIMALTSQSAANALAKYKTLAANATIAELTEMRAASPTGGALGNVSDYEDKMLRDAAATLDRAQDLATFKTALLDYRNKLTAAKARLLGAYAEDFGHEYSQYEQSGGEVPGPRGKTAPSNAGSSPPPGVTATEWQHMTPQERALWAK